MIVEPDGWTASPSTDRPALPVRLSVDLGAASLASSVPAPAAQRNARPDRARSPPCGGEQPVPAGTARTGVTAIHPALAQPLRPLPLMGLSTQ